MVTFSMMHGHTLFVFMGGGTGGHLFPGLAIAERLREKMGDRADFLFLCSQRDVDRAILGAEQIDGEAVAFEPLPAQPASRRPTGLMRFVGSWGSSVRAARSFLRHAKGAEFERVRAVAMGGFVAAPAAQAARAERIDLTMVNLDAVPGKANRWIAGRARRVLTAADAGPATWERIGPIVRRAALATGSAQECRAQLGLDPDLPTLLVTGASQGARSLNELMAAFARAQPGALAGWQVVHQAGAGADLDALREAYEGAQAPALVAPFFREMGQCWGAADLALARAGAGIVAEVAANRVPALFAPYPGHRDQHQRHNAEPLARAGGAAIETDHGAAGPNLEGLGGALAGLLADASRRQAMRAALGRIAPGDGAGRAAQALMA